MREISDEEILAQLPAAREAERRAAREEPRAARAEYDEATGRIVVELTSGWAFSFPPGVSGRLAKATPPQLAAVEVYPGGEALRWEAVDEDLSVPGLLRRLLPLTTAARAIGTQGGRKSTPAKARAARENGKKGGRPWKKDRDAA